MGDTGNFRTRRWEGMLRSLYGCGDDVFAVSLDFLVGCDAVNHDFVR